MLKTAYPTENKKETEKNFKEKRLKAPEKSIIEEAHPKPVYIAESKGDGALVENLLEQHDKMMEVINKMPSGALLGTYASTIETLVKLANQYDDLGQTKIADILTKTAEEIVEDAEYFFLAAPRG